MQLKQIKNTHICTLKLMCITRGRGQMTIITKHLKPNYHILFSKLNLAARTNLIKCLPICLYLSNVSD